MELLRTETRSSLNQPSQHTSEKLNQCTVSKSLTVEIEFNVKEEIKEFRGEGKADMEINQNEKRSRRSAERPNDKEFKSLNTMPSGDSNVLDLVSTLRGKDPVEKVEHSSKQSKSKYKRYRYDEDSRSRSGSSSDSRRYEVFNRGRRNYPRYRDRSRSRSNSRCRHRRYDISDRSRRTHDRDVRRSRSSSKDRRYRKYRYRHTNSNDRNAKQSGSSHISRNGDQLDRSRYGSRFNEKISCFRSNDSVEMCDTNHVPVSNQKQALEIFSGDPTIDTLRSRIKSALMESAGELKDDEISAKSNLIQSIPREKKYDAHPTSTATSSVEAGQKLIENRFDMPTTSNFEANKNASEESIEWKGKISIDDSIIQKIVATQTSSATIHSNLNMNEQLHFGRIIDPRIQKMLNLQFQSEQTATSNNRNQIYDQQIQKTLITPLPIQFQPNWPLSSQYVSANASMVPDDNGTNFPKTIPPKNPWQQGQYSTIQVPQSVNNVRDSVVFDQRKPNLFGKHTVGLQRNYPLYGNFRPTTENKPVPMTYGEHRRQQSLRATSKIDNDKTSTVPKPLSIPEVIMKPMKIKARKEVTEKKVVLRDKRKNNKKYLMPKTSLRESMCTIKKGSPSSLENQASLEATNENVMNTFKDSKLIKKPMEIKTRKKAKKMKAVVHNKLKKNKNYSTKETSLRESQNAIEEGIPSSLESQATLEITNENAMNPLKEMINPHHLLSLVDLIQEMDKTDSLTKVKQALKKCTNETDTIATDKDTQKLSTFTDSKLGSETKTTKRKNELDRLHEDIDNMFIRDGVLNATGRKQKLANTNIESSINDVTIVNRKKEIRNTPKTPSVSSVSKNNYEIPHTSTEAFHTVTPRTKRNVYKKVRSGDAEEDFDWIPNKRVKQKEAKTSVKPPVLQAMEALEPEKPRIKNNNLECHSLKKILVCQICDTPPGISLISHYVNFHPNSEILTSRLSPEAATCLRSSTQTQFEAIRSESGHMTYKQFCYFCNTYHTYSKVYWIDHMIRHTGYFHYKCGDCSKKFTTMARYHVCRDRQLNVEKVRQNNVKRILQPIFKRENIQAFICELCNYVRFYEHEMKMHLDNEHEDGDAKEFKEFTFLTLPKMKIGRPKKHKIHEESESKVDSESTSDEENYSDTTDTYHESESETEIASESESVAGEDYESKVQAEPIEDCDQLSDANKKTDEFNQEGEWVIISSGSESDVILL